MPARIGSLANVRQLVVVGCQASPTRQTLSRQPSEAPSLDLQVLTLLVGYTLKAEQAGQQEIPWGVSWCGMEAVDAGACGYHGNRQGVPR